MSALTIAVIGNPNSGKSSLFNALTGARQYVGNWPGVTVDRKTGAYEHQGRTVRVVDLPGVYTLGSVPGVDSLDEKVAQDYALSGEADVFVNVLDASNLERNLYLTAQLLELRVPLVVVLNMADRVERAGQTLDAAGLARRLGCPVVVTAASKMRGIDGLKDAIVAAAKGTPPRAQVAYAPEVESTLAAVEGLLADVAAARAVSPRWLAVKMLERDGAARAMVDEDTAAAVDAHIVALEAAAGDDADTLIADGRYMFAHELAHDAVGTVSVAAARQRSDAVDRVVLNSWLGIPIFFAVMYLMFTISINVGGAFIDFFDMAAGTLFVDGTAALLDTLDAPVWMRVLLADGIGGGIQVVATFVPIIGFLYLCLSVLEDSGYMARAAYLMDRAMRAVGLPGKAFVPLIVGFGCNVPAVMAARTLERERDRIMTAMMAPFMSCGARLAVYALFAAAFFPSGGQNVVFALYLIGIAVAIATGFILKKTLLMGPSAPFIMELPTYNLPQLRGVWIHTWMRLKSFVFGAGKVIVVVVTVLSFLNSIGTDGTFGNEDSETSLLSTIGRAIVPAFTPMGLEADNWPATVGIFTGLFAKEAVVGTLDALYGGLDANSDTVALPGEDDGAAAGIAAYDPWAGLAAALATIPENLSSLGARLIDPLDLDSVQEAGDEVAQNTFGAMTARFDGQAGAFAYMVLILLYTPCVAVLGAISREFGARWMVFAAAWTSAVAYGVATGFYQAATFTRHPGTSAAVLVALVAAFAALFAFMRRVGQAGSGSGGALPGAAE